MRRGGAIRLRARNNAAPVVDAGEDDTHDVLTGYQLAGSVTDDGWPGPVTVQWSKVSGPGAATFADAAALDTTVDFTAAGTYVLRLTATDGIFAAHDDVEIEVTAADLLAMMTAAGFGAKLLRWWEVPDAASPLISIVSGNVAQLNDRVGSAHKVQGTPGNRPVFNATGGPSNLPYLSLPDVNRVLAATLSIATGNRVCLYTVQRHTASASQLYPYFCNPTFSTPSDTAYVQFTRFSGGSQSLSVSSPAKTTNWHRRSMRPLATGAISQINGVTTTPNFTGSDTAREITTASVGVAGFSGGDWAFSCLVDNATDDVDAVVNAYLDARGM